MSRDFKAELEDAISGAVYVGHQRNYESHEITRNVLEAIAPVIEEFQESILQGVRETAEEIGELHHREVADLRLGLTKIKDLPPFKIFKAKKIARQSLTDSVFWQ